MPESDDTGISINPGYMLGQLSRAMVAAKEHPDEAVRQRAVKRIERWEKVFQGMLNGAISFGTRTPIQEIPAWVTLEVVQGGFATGNLMAGGVLLPHELDLLSRLRRPSDDTARAALNIYYLSDSGQRDLCEMLQSGRYRINVPEEGALLVAAWLLSHEMTEKAQELIDAITPFFDRLRFYPTPDDLPIVPSPTVHRHTVGETVTALSERHPQAQVAKMIEAVTVWQPLYDRTVFLFLETVEDDVPCRKFSSDWHTRAQALLDEYAKLRNVHVLCRKPDRPKENFSRLRGYLNMCIESSTHTHEGPALSRAFGAAMRLFKNPDAARPPGLSTRDIGMIRHILHAYVSRHGDPSSEQFAQRRKEQTALVSLPTHEELRRVLLTRLQRYPQAMGIANLGSVVSPVASDESVQFKIPAGWSIPESLVLKVRRCWEAPLEQLVEEGVVPSGDVLAEVLPQITSQVRAASIDDRDLRRVYSAIYSAFRRRRSLLLLNLERQVRLEDLPWIATLNSLRHDDLDTKEQARQTLEQVTTIAIVSFPHAILPNKLLQELRSLINAAGLSLPIVDELAVDIFTGAFSAKFLRAAQLAGQMLHGTLYERYFGLPYERLLQLEGPSADGPNVSSRDRSGVSPEFAALCEELAHIDKSEPWSVSRNGRIIEQSQILTTHNLASLFITLELRNTPSERLRKLSEQCFLWSSRQQARSSWKANSRMMKNTAYAWRQMVFFLSLLAPEAVSSFLLWARGYLEQQNASVKQRLNPALTGLEWIVGGGSFDPAGMGGVDGTGVRLLGWNAKHN